LDVRKKIIICQAVRRKKGREEQDSLDLITEEPFLIRIDGNPYSVVMRTPGEELFHAAGFCLGEGIIDTPDDFTSIEYNEHSDPNVIDIRLKPARREKISCVLQRRSFVSQTSCGICGKQLIDDLYQILTPVQNCLTIDGKRIFNGINTLSEKQKFYQKTRGSHAALLLDDKMKAIAFAEDVGRHNALDKAIGEALMGGRLSNACILILSSRTSYELVQKAARAQLPLIISHSRPTALAVEMAKDLNMTLGFPEKRCELVIVCGEHRIKTTNSKAT
jgi:FdhD protein